MDLKEDGVKLTREVPRNMPSVSLITKSVAEELVERHKRYLESMETSQLESIIQRLLSELYPQSQKQEEKEKDKEQSESFGQVEGARVGKDTREEDAGSLSATDLLTRSQLKNEDDSEEEDLNKLSDSELAARKTQMDKLFEANRKLPGEEGFEYDKSVDFGEQEGKMECGWDDDVDDNNDDEW